MLFQLKSKFRLFIGNKPIFFKAYYGLRPKFKDLVVNNNTEIVIEGYPRSGNTYAVAAFQFSQKKQYNIARHLHLPAQIILAANNELPIIFIVRDPLDSIASYHIRHPEYSLEFAMNYYYQLHKTILPYKNKMVVARFEEVVKDFNAVIEKVNCLFSVKFELLVNQGDSEEEIFQIVEKMEVKDSGGNKLRETHVARPSSVRQELKLNIIEDIKAHKSLLSKCYSAYESLVD